ncbi:MAG: S9 family peptidase [Gemmataceae bacterium]|nr:S9 family peptidase [Gemmataceae bacterium]
MTRVRLLLAGLVALPAAALAQPPAPPAAKPIPHRTELHGDTRVDDYFWLREKTNPEVIKYLEAENAYTAAVLKPTEELQATLYKEFLGRIQQTDADVPVKEKGYWYYSRTVEGQNYPIHCRKKGSLDAAEEVLLDGNALAKGEKFFNIGFRLPSDDGTLLAYATDATGFREYMLSVKDLRTGKLVEDKLAKAAGFVWAADGKTLFYVTEDPAKRPHKLWRHTLGQPREKDALVYEEADPLFNLVIARSRDGKYLFRSSTSFTSSEQAYLPADEPAGEWRVILPRQPDHEYSAEHRDGTLYILTNKDATNFKVVTCPVGKSDPAGWKDLTPYDPAVFVRDVDVFKDHLVVSARVNGLPQLMVRPFGPGDAHTIEFPEAVYEAGLGANPEFDTPTVRLTYTSLVTPPSQYEYDLKSKARKLLKPQPVLGGYDPEQYQTERTLATAPDGTKVPVSLVYKKGVKKDGTAPCLLYAYGSYGAIMPVAFDPTRLSLLDRGVVYALAHIRGGSDLGRTWYDDGKMLKKKNTFTDFVACADHLVKEGYCARDRLAIQGGSAGGLLVGATLNLRPDLCKAAVLQVPFVDVINTMLDESLPLTTQEFQQWGNPKVTEQYEYLKSYCPYSNLKKGDYPAVLVTTSLNDSQVMYHEPAKYVAKLRTLKTDPRPLVMKCNMAGGHGGASGRYDALKERALVMAFVLDQIGAAK